MIVLGGAWTLNAEIGTSPSAGAVNVSLNTATSRPGAFPLLAGRKIIVGAGLPLSGSAVKVKYATYAHGLSLATSESRATLLASRAALAWMTACSAIVFVLPA